LEGNDERVEFTFFKAKEQSSGWSKNFDVHWVGILRKVNM
jgi:hypothetical protein